MSMTVQSLRRYFFALALALILVGIAGTASADTLVCIALDHGVPARPLLQLVPTAVGNGFVSIVGRRTHPVGGDRGVVTGGGVTTNGVFEISLQSTTIVTTPRFGPAPVLISGSTHILLNPTTQRGTFKTLEIVTADDAVHTEHVGGTATIVPCP
jgi:hypothetical protein